MRTLLLGVVLLGEIGLLVELLLLEHYESVQELIPVVLIVLATAASLLLALRPSAGAVHVFRWLMVVSMAAAVLGTYLHYRSNWEFEREMDATAAVPATLWRAMRGGTPALAPGALLQLGLLGLLVTYRHPALTRRGGQANP